MVHGLEAVETDGPAAPAVAAAGPLDRILAHVNHVIVIVSSVALVGAAFVLTYSVASRYFLHLSTDWQDELSVFLIVGAVFMSSAAIQARRGHVAIEAVGGLLCARACPAPPHSFVVAVVVVFFSCSCLSKTRWLLFYPEALVDDFHSSSTWG